MNVEIQAHIREIQARILKKNKQKNSIRDDFDKGRISTSHQRNQLLKDCDDEIEELENELIDFQDKLNNGNFIDDHSVKKTFRGKTSRPTYEMFRDVVDQAVETLVEVAKNKVPGNQFIQNIEDVTSPSSDHEPFAPWSKVEYTYSWFSGEYKTQEERAFIVTLALFGGISQTEIFDAFRHIKQIFEVRENPRLDEPFKSPIADLLDVADAKFTEYERLSNAGFVTSTAINFSDDRAPGLILLMLCRYFHRQELPELLKTLADVAENGKTGSLRERAAIALGMFGQIDFEWIHSPYITKWAKRSRTRMIPRYVISTILYSIYQPNGKYNDNIFSLVKNWATIRWNFNLWLTAAICCSRLGTLDAEKTIPILENLILHDHIDLIDPLIHAFSYILQGSDEKQIIVIFNHFRRWTSSGDETLQLGSILIFIGWIHVTLKRDFRRFIIPSLEKGRDIDFWNLPVEYDGENVRDFRLNYIYVLSDILGNGLKLGPVVMREISILLKELILISEYRKRYQPLVQDIMVELCSNPKYENHLRQWIFNILERWVDAPRYKDKQFLKVIFARIKQYYK